ncbi:hypothetical protein [Alienimonas sp. DA493]|uniref:hypothetical protein n=1 Tax=Alienimonas sp. DA493 TaxID=3373605 RepID=UPI003754D03C
MSRSLRCGLAVAAFCFACVLQGCGGPGEAIDEEGSERAVQRQQEAAAREGESGR